MVCDCLGAVTKSYIKSKIRVTRCSSDCMQRFWLEVRLLKCGLCKGEVKEQSMITAEGKCSNCGAKLAVAK